MSENNFELSDQPPENITEEPKENVSREDAFSILEKQAEESKKSEAIETIEEEDNTLQTIGSIPLGYFQYEPLSNGRIPSVPKILHYKKLDVIETLKLSELEYDLLDEQITAFLNDVVLEDFDHLDMPEADRSGVMMFYIAKNTGVHKSDVKGICETCEEIITIPKLDLSSFPQTEIPIDYAEPIYLKLQTFDKKYYLVGMRIATARDTIEANRYIEKRKVKDPKLKSQKLDFLKNLARMYALAVGMIIEDLDGNVLDKTIDKKIKFFSEELTVESREFIAKYYQKYSYGTDLVTKGVCSNAKCPSKKDVKTGDRRRLVSITVPFQKSFLAVTDAEERSLDEVIVHK